MTENIYYTLSSNRAKNPSGLMLDNESDLISAECPVYGIRDASKRGIPSLNKVPRFRYIKREGRLPQDIEDFRGILLVSEKAKCLFERVDSDAFEFKFCEIVNHNNIKMDKYWLCDVIRVLDALDELQSDAVIESIGGRKRYDLLRSRHLVFKKEIVGRSHIFRMDHRWTTVICDSAFRRACEEENLKNFIFKNVS